MSIAIAIGGPFIVLVIGLALLSWSHWRIRRARLWRRIEEIRETRI